MELMIPLPNVSSEIRMEASLGGETLISETLVPSEERFWNITIAGEGIGTVSIYYDGQLYRAYSVNFVERTSMVVADNSENFGG
jgi:hypothetical protein